RLVHGVFQRLRTGGDRIDLGAKQLHAEHVGAWPRNVDGAHENLARKAEAGADGGNRHAMLASPSLGDDARLAHALGQQDLSETVVYLVAARVIELISLEVDFGAAQMRG